MAECGGLKFGRPPFELACAGQQGLQTRRPISSQAVDPVGKGLRICIRCPWYTRFVPLGRAQCRKAAAAIHCRAGWFPTVSCGWAFGVRCERLRTAQRRREAPRPVDAGSLDAMRTAVAPLPEKANEQHYLFSSRCFWREFSPANRQSKAVTGPRRTRWHRPKVGCTPSTPVASVPVFADGQQVLELV